jgi:hypothetical protein
LYGAPARESRVSAVVTCSSLLGRLGSHRSGLVSICFTGRSSPGPRRDDLTNYWALGPFVRSFILPVDPGDIYPPHSAHGPARNCLNVPDSFRAARNYKSLKFTLGPEIHIRARNSHQSPKFKTNLIKQIKDKTNKFDQKET